MAELFRSAFNYISQTGKGNGGSDFVGQYVELGTVQLRVRRVIAEGKALSFVKNPLNFHLFLGESRVRFLESCFFNLEFTERY